VRHRGGRAHGRDGVERDDFCSIRAPPPKIEALRGDLRASVRATRLVDRLVRGGRWTVSRAGAVAIQLRGPVPAAKSLFPLL
jgi:hypothetical protein